MPDPGPACESCTSHPARRCRVSLPAIRCRLPSVPAPPDVCPSLRVGRPGEPVPGGELLAAAARVPGSLRLPFPGARPAPPPARCPKAGGAETPSPARVIASTRSRRASLGIESLTRVGAHRQHAIHHAGKPLPVAGIFSKLPPPVFGDRIELRFAVVAAYAPARLDPAALLQPHQRGVNRSLVQEDLVTAHLLDSPRDAISVLRTHCGQRLKHHQIQRSL